MHPAQKISALHQRLAANAWFSPALPCDWRRCIGAGVLILIAALLNFDVRLNQWQYWQSQRAVYFLGDTPLVSTTDAGFFLNHAEDYQQHKLLGNFQASRLYPDYTPAIEDRITEAGDIPLLSLIIATVADTLTHGNLALAGNLIIPYAVFVTILGLGVMFWVVGYPVEGAIAGMGLGLSSGFLVRTSAGRIDTDMLLMGFLALCLTLALSAAQSQNHARRLAWVLLTALGVALSYWWHANAVFVVIIPIVMAISLYLHQHRISHAVLALGVFILAINPVFFFGQASALVVDAISRFGFSIGVDVSPPEAMLSFPNSFTTITELVRLDVLGTLATMTPYSALSSIGAVGFVIWAALYPRKGIIFVPFFILGLLAVVLGRRFAFFATPFVWFGVAWLVLSSLRWLASLIQQRSGASGLIRTPLIRELLVFVTASLGLAGVYYASPHDFIPRASFSAEITRSFAAMPDIAGGAGGILATWWDYGYYARFHSGLDTIHDGGTQRTPRTHLFARGLTSHDTDALIQITKFITSGGTEAIAAHSTSLNRLNAAIAEAPMPDKPLYLMLTRQMGGWMGSIARLGGFDGTTGQYPKNLDSYVALEMTCPQQISPTLLHCQQGILDLDSGTIGGGRLGGVIVTQDGFIGATQPKSAASPWYVVVQAMTHQPTRFMLIQRDNWGNAFNRLFHQGVYNRDRLQLVLDHYPHARVYRIIQ